MKRVETIPLMHDTIGCVGILAVMVENPLNPTLGTIEPDGTFKSRQGKVILRPDTTLPLYAFQGPMWNIRSQAYFDPRSTGPDDAQCFVGSKIKVSYQSFVEMGGIIQYSDKWIPGLVAGFVGDEILVAVRMSDGPMILQCGYNEVIATRRYVKELEIWSPEGDIYRPN